MTAEKKQKITLVGVKQAKKNFIFLQEGELDECKDCERFNICIGNLEPGRIYKVETIRDKIFSCKVHEEGVRIVKVVEPDLEVAIESRQAFEGGTVAYKLQDCIKSSCENYGKCTPQGLKKGDKCKIIKVEGSIKCPLSRSLVLAKVQLSRE